MSVRKVLVIRFRRIGDAVLSVVICSSLRKSFPEAEIHYVLNDHIAPLFENHPDIDKIITFSDEENNHFFEYLRKVRQLMKTERYDVIIDTRATIKTLWFSAFSLRTKYRIGTSKFYNHFFHNYRVRNHVNDDLDEVVRNLLLLQPLEREGKLVMTGDRALSRFRNEKIGFVFQFHHLDRKSTLYRGMYSFYQSGEEGLGYGENEGNIVSYHSAL